MHNYLLTIQYDGNNFYGWAIQPDKETIQGKMKNVLDKYFNFYKWSVAGRTDRGVHAYGQVVSLSINRDFKEDKLRYILNRSLTPSIYIKQLKKSKRYIDIRKETKKREYRFFFKDIIVFKPWENNYYYFIDFKQVDFKMIKKGMEIFIGTHNFYNFSSNKRNVKHFERTVLHFELKQYKHSGYFSIIADSFLYNMVRRIIGTLFLLGQGKISIDFIEFLLNSKENLRTKTALIKPNGLYLWRVYY